MPRTRTSIDRSSVEYLTVPVSAPADVVLSGLDAEIAVTSSTERPVEEDWRAASWAGSSAQVLIGPGALSLDPGTYKVWLRVTDAPEVPVLMAGSITVS